MYSPNEELPLSLFFFKITGFWTTVATNFKSHKKFPFYLIQLTFISCCFVLQIITLLYNIIFLKNDTIVLINKIAFLATTLESGLKMIYIYKKRKQVQSLYPIFRNDFLLCRHFNEAKNNNILSKAVRSINFWSSLLIVTINATAILWLIYPLALSIYLNDFSNLSIFDSQYPEAIEYIPGHKILMYIFEVVITSHNGIYLSIFDAYIIIITFALDAQIQILKTSLKEVNTDFKRKSEEKYVANKFNNYSEGSELLLKFRTNKKTTSSLYKDNMLKTCITDHKRILQIIEEIENIYSPVNLFQMFISLVTISVLAVLSIVQISSNNDSADITNFTRLKMFLYIICGIAELFLFCWLGDTIRVQAENLCEGFYTTGWPEAYRSLKSNIHISMMRCRKPIHITAGKLYSVNFFAFTSIMKASYSFFSVLYGFISVANQKI